VTGEELMQEAAQEALQAALYENSHVHVAFWAVARLSLSTCLAVTSSLGARNATRMVLESAIARLAKR
tara:strand:+ start:482 stop:685 length:204 start_codon:yes stop_codon:yes gene_type:complete